MRERRTSMAGNGHGALNEGANGWKQACGLE